MKQREKRKKMRVALTKKGEKLDDYFYGKFFINIKK